MVPTASRIFLYITDSISRFFQLTKEGLLQYQQFTLQPKIYTQIQTQRGTTRNPDNYNLVFFSPDMVDRAYRFAITHNALSVVYDTTSAEKNARNLKFVYAKQNQASAVAGYFCYLLQQKYPDLYRHQVGVLYGQEGILALQDYFVGFKFGYAYEDPSKENDVILSRLPTTFIDNQVSFNVTRGFIDDNPDIGIFFPLNGAAYLGSYNAIHQASLYAIGVDDDYFNYVYSFNPDLAYIVLGSVLKYMDQLMFRYLTSRPATSTPKNTSYTLKDGVVDFIISSFVGDAEIRVKVDAFKQSIEKGRIIVPSVLP